MATITQVLEESVVVEAPPDDLPVINVDTGHRAETGMRGVVDHLHERLARRREEGQQLQEVQERLQNINLNDDDQRAKERARISDRADPPQR